MYSKTTTGNISHWLTEVAELGGIAETLIVYCITAEVRSKRPRAASIMKGIGFLEQVEETIVKDFKDKASK